MARSKRIAVIAILAFCAMAGSAGIAERASGVPAKPDDRVIVHVLNRLGFGAAPGDIDRVRRTGLQAYIDQQLQPERLADNGMKARLASFETLTMSTRELATEYIVPAQMARREAQRRQAASDPSKASDSQAGTPAAAAARRETMTPEQAEAVRMERQALTDLMQAKILRAAYSERQLEEVMVDFWFNHFNVFSGKGQVRVYLNEYERDTIRPHVLGKFHDLLEGNGGEPGDVVLPGQLAERGGRRRADARTGHGGPAIRSPKPRTLPADAAGTAEPARNAGRRSRRAEQAARAQRELRARADGAAHARRRRRLHAEGRPGNGARVHRVDDREPAAGRIIPVRAADARRGREGRAGPSDQGGRRQVRRR